MENIEMQERLNVQVTAADGEVVIRHGEARVLLDEIEPRRANLRGTLGVISEWLEKHHVPGGVTNGFVTRKDMGDEIGYLSETVKWSQCSLRVCRDNMSMTLDVDERNDRTCTSITGQLEVSKEMRDWAINDEVQTYTPEQLGKRVKMLRSQFADRQEAMTLAMELMHFKAKVNSDFNKYQEQNGNKGEGYSQVVESNLPKSFKLKIPVIKGMPKDEIEVEVYADVNGREVYLSLISPTAMDLEEEMKNRALDYEIEKVKALGDDVASGLAILEV